MTRLQEAARVYLVAKDGPKNNLSFRQVEKRFPSVKKSTLHTFKTGVHALCRIEFNIWFVFSPKIMAHLVTPIVAPVLESVPLLLHPGCSLAYGSPATTHGTCQDLQEENKFRIPPRAPLP